MTTSSPDTWPRVMATVTACHYNAGAGRALAFGLPTTRHFEITFNYWAPTPDGTPTLHTGTFNSAKAIPQGTLFPVTYNPAAPHQNTHSSAAPTTRNPIIAIGIIGSIILSLAWFAILRSCH